MLHIARRVAVVCTTLSTSVLAQAEPERLLRLEVMGMPGDWIILVASATPPTADARPLLGNPPQVDIATAFVVRGDSDRALGRLGETGRLRRELRVPEGLDPLSFRAQAFRIAGAGEIRATPVDVAVVDRFRFDFESGPQGWRAGFSDYPIGKEDFYELGRSHRFLPGTIAPGSRGVRLQGNNHSDDLFMYWKRRVDGLVPGEEYAVDATVRFASRYPASWLGIGGAPGSSVYLRAGASSVEPSNVVQPGPEPWWILNIDKGNQATPGTASAVLGHIGTPGNEGTWDLIEERTESSVFARANEHGELWLHFGTDSGFEGFTEIYYDEVTFAVRPRR